MPITTETVSESKWREGKIFTHLQSKDVLLAGGVENFVICVGNKPVVLNNVSIESDAETMTWKGYINAEPDEDTGDIISPIPRNSTAKTTPGAFVVVNPGIIKPGDPFFDTPIQLVAQQAAGNRNYLNEAIIDSPFTLEAFNCYVIEITNNTAADCRYDLSMEIWNS